MIRALFYFSLILLRSSYGGHVATLAVHRFRSIRSISRLNVGVAFCTVPLPKFARSALAETVLHGALKIFQRQWQAHAFIKRKFIGRDFEILFAVNAGENIFPVFLAICAGLDFLGSLIGKIVFGHGFVVFKRRCLWWQKVSVC